MQQDHFGSDDLFSESRLLSTGLHLLYCESWPTVGYCSGPINDDEGHMSCCCHALLNRSSAKSPKHFKTPVGRGLRIDVKHEGWLLLMQRPCYPDKVDIRTMVSSVPWPFWFMQPHRRDSRSLIILCLSTTINATRL